MSLAWANWCWKAVSQFILERFAKALSRTTCINYLHRLGFVLKRPGKRLLKADVEKWEAFVSEYQTLRQEAEANGILGHHLGQRPRPSRSGDARLLGNA